MSQPASPAPTLVGGSTPVDTPNSHYRGLANLDASPPASPTPTLIGGSTPVDTPVTYYRGRANLNESPPACKRKLIF